MRPTFRNRVAAAVAALTVLILGGAFFASPGIGPLMPGPLSSAHGTIEACSTCHSQSGSSKLSWLHGLIAGDPRADSKACLSCHKMPATAFAPHGAAKEVLAASTKRLRDIALRLSPPLDARLQNAAFPMTRVMGRDLYCATCHQEHKGSAFKLAEITNEQCRSCHAAKFDSFEGHHPEFADYPFRRRTRLIFDHAGHFDRHFPEIAKKGGGKRIPETCASCHDDRGDRRIMAVAKFDDTCATCHLDQITGKERASGPKGVAFLTLPGLDLATLKARKVKIGEWPDGSEAGLTPFMTLMIGRDERGRALLRTIATLKLDDLANASDAQVKAVADLGWAIKRLYYALITGKGSDVLSGLGGPGANPSPALVADLTASLPRDVLIGAQKEWLPHLAEELGEAPLAAGTEPAPAGDADTAPAVEDAAGTADAQATSPETGDASEAADASVPDASGEAAPGAADDETSSLAAPAKSRLDPPPCSVSILGACLVSEEKKDSADAVAPFPIVDTPPQRHGAAEDEVRLAAAGDQQATGTNKSKDELLFPTDAELDAIKAHYKAAGQAEPKRAPPGEGGGVGPGEAADAPASADAASGDGGIDPESWADYGGWYRQDYTIYYGPVGHKDRFLYAWLTLAGRSAVADGNERADVFQTLTAKDAPGACTKCHSVDAGAGKSRRVNFAPLKAEAKQGRFTAFAHAPHLSVVGDQGCLTCHDLGKPKTAAAGAQEAKSESAYLATYKQKDPTQFVPEFGAVKKEICQSCHKAGAARQDCLLCHAYHVNGVVTPITGTKLPAP